MCRTYVTSSMMYIQRDRISVDETYLPRLRGKLEQAQNYILQQIFDINNRPACSDIKILWVYICVTCDRNISSYPGNHFRDSGTERVTRQFLISFSIFFNRRVIIISVLSYERSLSKSCRKPVEFFFYIRRERKPVENYESHVVREFSLNANALLRIGNAV